MDVDTEIKGGDDPEDPDPEDPDPEDPDREDRDPEDPDEGSEKGSDESIGLANQSRPQEV